VTDLAPSVRLSRVSLVCSSISRRGFVSLAFRWFVRRSRGEQLAALGEVRHFFGDGASWIYPAVGTHEALPRAPPPPAPLRADRGADDGASSGGGVGGAAGGGARGGAAPTTGGDDDDGGGGEGGHSQEVVAPRVGWLGGGLRLSASLGASTCRQAAGVFVTRIEESLPGLGVGETAVASDDDDSGAPRGARRRRRGGPPARVRVCRPPNIPEDKHGGGTFLVQYALQLLE